MRFLERAAAMLKALSPTCREASRLQSDALERPLPASTRLGLLLHLKICKWCRRYGEQIRFLHEAGKTGGEKLAESAPERLSEAARARIKEKLEGK